MKVLFAGPSLHGTAADLSGLDVRAPARQGDIARAVLDGAEAIGLIDGLFETVAAVWHKEILFALSHGVAVLGAASMGALRAAECGEFGMRPVGEIAERYVSGELDDDAAVAQLHAPAEFGFAPLTEALVDTEATIAGLLAGEMIDRSEAQALLEAARGLFFKERTIPAVCAAAGLARHREHEVAALMAARRVSPKRQDALRLVAELKALPAGRSPSPGDWTIAEPAIWRRSLAAIEEGAPTPLS